MIHIVYIPSTDNRLGSGHIMWEIFTTFIFSMFVDGMPIWDKTWNNTSIITEKAFKKYTTTPLETYNYKLLINQYREWGSLSYLQFITIIKQIKDASQKYKNILVQLSNVCKIHPDVLCNWYNTNKIKNDIYSLQTKPLIKKLYYEDNAALPIRNEFTIHIRRGDLAQWCYDVGFTLNYYTNIINIINTHLDMPIRIYCEDGFTDRGGSRDKKMKYFNYNDIMILEKLDNVKIIKGNPLGSDFNAHFNDLCRSRILMVSPSSFSLWAAFITDGIVLVDKKNIAARVNLFRYCEEVPNFIVFDNLKDKMKEIQNKI